MEAVIAGWVAGYTMAALSTIALTYLAWASEGPRFFRRWMGDGVPAALVAVPASLGCFIAWTLAGLVLGAAYWLADLGAGPGARQPEPGLPRGDRRPGGAPLPLLVILWPRRWWVWTTMSAAFLAAFGWLMPLLAAR